MARRPHLICQDPLETVIKCPQCKNGIRLIHGRHEDATRDTANDDIGRLDLGEQNYTAVVCMHGYQSGSYCDWSGLFDVKAS